MKHLEQLQKYLYCKGAFKFLACFQFGYQRQLHLKLSHELFATQML